MSIETLTGDEFEHLLPEEHEEALNLYAAAVQAAAGCLQRHEPGTIAHEECLDKIARQLTLRRVHQVRLAEQREDEQAAFNPEVDQLPA